MFVAYHRAPLKTPAWEANLFVLHLGHGFRVQYESTGYQLITFSDRIISDLQQSQDVTFSNSLTADKWQAICTNLTSSLINKIPQNNHVHALAFSL